MDFEWAPEQEALYERIRRFAREQLVMDAHERDRTGTFAQDEWRRCGAAGLLGLCVSPTYGGRGVDCLTTARTLEAFGRECRDAGLCFSIGAHLLACALPIDQFGTPAQKAAYLPSLCDGTCIGANAATEQHAGSDVFALEMTAVTVDGGYILNGEKTFVTNAPVAGLFLVYAATRPQEGFFGISAFLVSRDTPGVIVGPPLDKSGLTTTPASTLRLEDCRVADSQRLGPAGAGGAIFQASMTWERCCLFALWLGTMERQLEDVVRHARTRKQFGKPIGVNQAVSHRIADMKLRLEAARLLVYRACWERGRRGASDLTPSLAKLAVSEGFVQSSLDAVQIFGAAGVTRDGGIERYVRDALPSTIYSGTSDMQREIIARAIGLPVVPRTQEGSCHASKSSS
jgi:L-prolyl-PCP dehydrogenase